MKAKTTARRRWTPAEIKTLRRLAKEKKPARVIARELKRSLKAVYQQGFKLKVRFLGTLKAKKK